MTPTQAWHRLGLSPTGDKRAINRAYAQCLRRTRPEDDAQAFAMLVEARNLALQHTSLIDLNGEAPLEVEPEEQRDDIPGEGAKTAPNFASSKQSAPESGPDTEAEPDPGDETETDTFDNQCRPEPPVIPLARLLPPPRPSPRVETQPLRDAVGYLLSERLNRKPVIWHRADWEPVFRYLSEASLDEQREFSLRLLKGILPVLPSPAQMTAGSDSLATVMWIVGVLSGSYGHDSRRVAHYSSVRQALIWSDWLNLIARAAELPTEQKALTAADWQGVLPLSYHLMALFPLKCRQASVRNSLPGFRARLWSRIKFGIMSVLFPNYTVFEAGIGPWAYLYVALTLFLFVVTFIFIIGSAATGAPDLLDLVGHKSLKAILDLFGLPKATARQILLKVTFAVRFLPLLLIPLLIARYARKRIRIANMRCLVTASQRAPVLDPCLRRTGSQAGQLLDILGLMSIALLAFIGPGGALTDTSWRFAGPAEPRSLDDRNVTMFLRTGSSDGGLYIGYRLPSSGSNASFVGVSSCLPGKDGQFRCSATLRLPGEEVRWLVNPDGLPAIRTDYSGQSTASLDFSPITYRSKDRDGWMHPPLITLCMRGDLTCRFFLGRDAAAVTVVLRKTENDVFHAVVLWRGDMANQRGSRVHLTPALSGQTVWLDGTTADNEALFLVANAPALPSLYAQSMNQPPRRLGTFPLRPVDRLDVDQLGSRIVLRGWFSTPKGASLKGYIVEGGKIRAIMPEDCIFLLRKGHERADEVFNLADSLGYSVDGGESWHDLPLPKSLQNAMFVTDGKQLYAYGSAGIYVRSLATLPKP